MKWCHFREDELGAETEDQNECLRIQNDEYRGCLQYLCIQIPLPWLPTQCVMYSAVISYKIFIHCTHRCSNPIISLTYEVLQHAQDPLCVCTYMLACAHMCLPLSVSLCLSVCLSVVHASVGMHIHFYFVRYHPT